MIVEVGSSNTLRKLIFKSDLISVQPFIKFRVAETGA